MPGQRIEAVDWSMHQPAHTPEDMRRLVESGVGLVIVGGWHGDDMGGNANCQADLALARAHGLQTAVYLVVDSAEGTDARTAVGYARGLCGAEWDRASFVAIDVEVPGVTTADVRIAVDEIKATGKRPIIYSAYWFWHDTFGNPLELCDVPVWNALYDYESDFDFVDVPYGCWLEENVVGEQYQSDSKLPGLELDHNSFRAGWVTPPPPEASGPTCDGLAPDQMQKLTALYTEAGLKAPADCAAPKDANGDGETNSLDALPQPAIAPSPAPRPVEKPTPTLEAIRRWAEAISNLQDRHVEDAKPTHDEKAESASPGHSKGRTE